MDALTNVVAVLILVLILVQADVSKKVVEFLQGLEPATPEQVVASTKKVQELEAAREKLDQLLSQEAPSQKELEVEQRQLALLEKSRDERKDLLANLKELQELAKKVEAERDAEAKKTETIQDEIAKLEALLDQTPVLKVDPTVVGIPASRPIPKDAEVYHAIVINDRVHFIDPFTPLKLFEDEFRKAKRDFPHQRIKKQGADRYIYQSGPIVKHFENFDFRNSRNQKVKVVAYPTATRLRLTITPDQKEGGSSLEDLQEADGLFSKILGRLRLNSRAVLIFHVHPNSFNAYLQARRLTDQYRVAAGWEVRGMNSYDVIIPEVEVKQEKQPGPAAPGERPPSLPTRID